MNHIFLWCASCCRAQSQWPCAEVCAFDLLFSGVIFLFKLYWHYFQFFFFFFKELRWVTLSHPNFYTCSLLVALGREVFFGSLEYKLLPVPGLSVPICKMQHLYYTVPVAPFHPTVPSRVSCSYPGSLSSLKNGWFKTTRVSCSPVSVGQLNWQV